MGLVYMLVSFTNAIHVSFILIKYVLPGFRQKNLPIIKHLPAKPRREIYHANKDSHSCNLMKAINLNEAISYLIILSY